MSSADTSAGTARHRKAHADQEAAERELAAASMKAQFERDTAIKRAGYPAEAERIRRPAIVRQFRPL
jgi:flotillin